MRDPQQHVSQGRDRTHHHCHTGMYEDLKEYLNWYDTRRDTKFAADAPVIGLVLQRSHLVTGDEGHYSGVVSELEAQGAKVQRVFIAPSCGTGLAALLQPALFVAIQHALAQNVFW